MWSDSSLKRIRHHLRDPDGTIWSDSFLLRAYNDEQRDFFATLNLLEKVEALRIPQQYGCSYMFEWEWQFTTGKPFRALKYHHQSDIVYTHVWEAQFLGIGSGSDTDYGEHFTHPWEGFQVTTCAEIPPAWFPPDYESARLIAWDKDPIEYLPQKQIQSNNSAWQTESGTPRYYFRKDNLSNEFYLYPKPSTVSFTGADDTGQVVNVDDETADTEYGTITDVPGYFPQARGGIATDVVDDDGNILLIYYARAVDIQSWADEPDYPVWIQKYINHGTIQRAYKANTDGFNEGLAEYWGWRRELGIEAVRTFKQKRLVDRDYRLISRGGGLVSGRTKHPRLPDTYPAVYP